MSRITPINSLRRFEIQKSTLLFSNIVKIRQGNETKAGRAGCIKANSKSIKPSYLFLDTPLLARLDHFGILLSIKSYNGFGRGGLKIRILFFKNITTKHMKKWLRKCLSKFTKALTNDIMKSLSKYESDM